MDRSERCSVRRPEVLPGRPTADICNCVCSASVLPDGDGGGAGCAATRRVGGWGRLGRRCRSAAVGAAVGDVVHRLGRWRRRCACSRCWIGAASGRARVRRAGCGNRRRALTRDRVVASGGSTRRTGGGRPDGVSVHRLVRYGCAGAVGDGGTALVGAGRGGTGATRARSGRHRVTRGDRPARQLTARQPARSRLRQGKGSGNCRGNTDVRRVHLWPLRSCGSASAALQRRVAALTIAAPSSQAGYARDPSPRRPASGSMPSSSTWKPSSR